MRHASLWLYSDTECADREPLSIFGHTDTTPHSTVDQPTMTDVFAMPGLGAHPHLSVGAGGGGEDPSYPHNNWSTKSAHEVDAVVPRGRMSRTTGAGGGSGSGSGYGAFPCPVCQRVFASQKAVHGHMRTHHDRQWRGMEPPRAPPLGVLAADGQLHPYACDRCGAPFETRQALGGHRASHSGKKGCFWFSKQDAAKEAAASNKFAFDLNDPAPEMEE